MIRNVEGRQRVGVHRLIMISDEPVDDAFAALAKSMKGPPL